jgi:hypothetical protein
MRSARPFSFAATSVLCLVALVASACSTRNSADTSDALRPHAADAYPDFSQPLDSAMEQMTDEQAARQEAQLTALSRQRQAGRISEAEYRRRVEALRLLGRETAQ